MQSTIYQNMLVFSMSLYVQHNNNALFPSRCCYAMYVSHFTSPSYIAQDGRFQPIQKTTLTRNPEEYAYWLMLLVGYCELVVCSVTITNKYINEWRMIRFITIWNKSERQLRTIPEQTFHGTTQGTCQLGWIGSCYWQFMNSGGGQGGSSTRVLACWSRK